MYQQILADRVRFDISECTQTIERCEKLLKEATAKREEAIKVLAMLRCDR